MGSGNPSVPDFPVIPRMSDPRFGYPMMVNVCEWSAVTTINVCKNPESAQIFLRKQYLN
jgi:hypothetical protein